MANKDMGKYTGGLSFQEKVQLLSLLEEKEKRVETGGHLVKLFPDKGPYSWKNYPKHMDFINAGSMYKVRFFMGANRCLAKGTLVATPSGPVPIEELKVGDTVYDRNGEETKVIETWDNGERDVVELWDGPILYLTCTPDHDIEVYTNGGFEKKQAQEFADGGLIRQVTNKSRPNLDYGINITDVKTAGRAQVYDITVEQEDHMFLLANGLCVANCGKALPLDERVMTPSGPVKMGDLSVGDEVIDEHGNAVAITGYFPQGERDCYKFTTYDGSEIVSSDEHLWLTRTTTEGKDGQFKIRTTKEIVDDKKVHVLPNRPKIKYAQKDLAIDPYLFGCLIGDGGLSGKCVFLTIMDQEIVDYCTSAAHEYECEFKKLGQDYGYQFVSRLTGPHGYRYNLLKDLINGYGLNCTAHYKFIPDDYKYGSYEDRLAMLQGLMDTDGTCSKARHVEFYTSSKQLALDVKELVNSLGGNASLKTKKPPKGTDYGESYRVYIYSGSMECPFRLSRKIANFSEGENQPRGLSIKKKEYVGKKDCACIKVDSESGLFMVGDYLVTHNTELGSYELCCHLTGQYPHWWTGKVFDHPIEAWGASDTSSTTRDILQFKLLGNPGEMGQGLLAADRIANVRMKSGVPDAVESVKVKHISGGYSWLGFKSYDQGRRTFQGTAKHVILLDEEPRDEGIISECVVRTMTTSGIVMITATPLMGLTPLVQSFMDEADTPNTKEDFTT